MNDILLFFQFYWMEITGVIGLLHLTFFYKRWLFYFLIIFTSIIVVYLGGGFYEYVVIALLALPSIIIQTQITNKRADEKNPFSVKLKKDDWFSEFIDDINRGIAIFGASGSGKSEGPIFHLVLHMAKYGYAGIINDYKNYELAEKAYPVFKDAGVPAKIWNVGDPSRSVRINVLDPDYIKDETDLRTITEALFLNLYNGDATGTEGFFRDAGMSLFNATVWILKEEYPDLCNVPFVISLLLSDENMHIHTPKGIIPYQRLIDWINSNTRATILGSTFLKGAASSKQTAAIFSTLAQALQKLASPASFYLMMENEQPLDLNADHNRSVLFLVNDPDKRSSYSPINAMVAECAMKGMSKRGRKPGFVMLDEAPTMNLNDLSTKVATLRSFGVSFIYCMQDKIQADVQNKGRSYIMKSIISNLSIQFFGKINDPETGKYYEAHFEMIEKEQKTVSKGQTDIFSGKSDQARVTTSKKEESKFRSQIFFTLKPGEFVMFASGKAKKFRFKYYSKARKELPIPLREISAEELEENYKDILELGKNFLISIDF